MRTTFALGLVTAALIGVCAAPAFAHSVPRTAKAGAAAGTLTAVGVHNGWWAGAGTASTTAGIVSTIPVGIIGAAVTLTGYEAIVCKTMHADPFGLGCTHLSWRDPAYRGR